MRAHLRTLFFIVLSVAPCRAMIYDNKFLPLGPYRFSRKYTDSTIAVPQAFAITGHESHSVTHEDVALFGLYGSYNLAAVSNALGDVGSPNPLRSEWRTATIPWRMDGKVQGGGLAIAYNQPLTDTLSFTANTMFLHMRSRIDFTLLTGSVTPTHVKEGSGNIGELDRTRRQANDFLGITSEVASEAGFGDLDASVRYGKKWDYPRKFKSIDAGGRFGIIFPTGVRRHYNNAASLAFGSDGHYGVYFEGDGEFELKEDIKFSTFARLTKRVGRELMHRVPTQQWREAINYGAIVGKFKVDPGVALTFGAKVALEDINRGFGASVRYIWTKKWCDTWTDKRSDQTVAFAKNSMESFSRFTSEYVTIGAFYDFSKRVTVDDTGPLISLTWDIPTTQLGGEGVAAINRVTVGVEWDF
ncbi:hypothetical protein JW872_01960 [Candidatus Babeliales bacterium]|nr:hypothetical protein [Candidatus Babeliales bacterium]